MTAKTRKWEGVTGGNTLGQRGLLLLFHVANISVLYVILALVVPFYMLFRIKGYLPVYHYFRRQFGCSPLVAFARTYRNHFLFGQCLLDRFAVYAGHRNLFALKLTGNEHFTELLAGQKGFIMASSHTGNFELSGYLLRQTVKRIHSLVYGGETKEVMANRARALQRNNVGMIPVADDLSHIFAISDALRVGDIVSMPCDRNLGSAKSVECQFLNGKADFPLGPFMLAAQFEAPMLAIFVMKESATTYHAYVKPLPTPDAALTRKEKAATLARHYAAELENMVRAYPEQWFNFYEFWK